MDEALPKIAKHYEIFKKGVSGGNIVMWGQFESIRTLNA